MYVSSGTPTPSKLIINDEFYLRLILFGIRANQNIKNRMAREKCLRIYIHIVRIVLKSYEIFRVVSFGIKVNYHVEYHIQ